MFFLNMKWEVPLLPLNLISVRFIGFMIQVLLQMPFLYINSIFFSFKVYWESYIILFFVSFVIQTFFLLLIFFATPLSYSPHLDHLVRVWSDGERLIWRDGRLCWGWWMGLVDWINVEEEVEEVMAFERWYCEWWVVDLVGEIKHWNDTNKT